MQKAPLKIAIVCSTLNQLGGPATHIRNIYRQLHGEEFRLTLIFSAAVEDELRAFMLAGGVDARDMIFIPHAQKRALVPFVLTLRNIFFTERFDIVHAFETQTQVLAGLAARLAGVKNFICNCEAQFLPLTISWPKRMLFRLLNAGLKNYFRLTLTISHGLARELAAGGLRPADKVEVLHLGIEAGQAPKTIVGGRRGPVIGALSRFSVEKGLDRLVKASALVVREIPEARFVLCGDGQEALRLKGLVAELSLERSFEFRPWTNDVRSEMARYDIYVMPSLREGLGITLLEAMSIGCPVVASDIEGIRDVIENGVDGILVDTADPKALARAIVGLCRDPQAAAGLGRRGFEKVRERFDVRREATRLREIYRQCGQGADLCRK
ncbi:MAG: glycosyltransferase family 4 protein [Candidatus Omnitrophica bacterium]|nr:glycosyltransferase family 4 protein [Candidatus Omnitrophota bacterium]